MTVTDQFDAEIDHAINNIISRRIRPSAIPIRQIAEVMMLQKGISTDSLNGLIDSVARRSIGRGLAIEFS